jgi:hypothetical protein
VDEEVVELPELVVSDEEDELVEVSSVCVMVFSGAAPVGATGAVTIRSGHCEVEVASVYVAAG